MHDAFEAAHNLVGSNCPTWNESPLPEASEEGPDADEVEEDEADSCTRPPAPAEMLAASI
jgi:hypothetical protein